jgi:hypothetical protein
VEEELTPGLLAVDSTRLPVEVYTLRVVLNKLAVVTIMEVEVSPKESQDLTVGRVQQRNVLSSFENF